MPAARGQATAAFSPLHGQHTRQLEALSPTSGPARAHCRAHRRAHSNHLLRRVRRHRHRRCNDSRQFVPGVICARRDARGHFEHAGQIGCIMEACSGSAFCPPFRCWKDTAKSCTSTVRSIIGSECSSARMSISARPATRPTLGSPNIFAKLRPIAGTGADVLDVLGRPIAYRQEADGVVLVRLRADLRWSPQPSRLYRALALLSDRDRLECPAIRC